MHVRSLSWKIPPHCQDNILRKPLHQWCDSLKSMPKLNWHPPFRAVFALSQCSCPGSYRTEFLSLEGIKRCLFAKQDQSSEWSREPSAALTLTQPLVSGRALLVLTFGPTEAVFSHLFPIFCALIQVKPRKTLFKKKTKQSTTMIGRMKTCLFQSAEPPRKSQTVCCFCNVNKKLQLIFQSTVLNPLV